MPDLVKLERLLADLGMEVGIAQDLAGHGKFDRVLVAMDRVSKEQVMARMPLAGAALLGLAALAVALRLALYLARGPLLQRDPPRIVRWWRARRARPLYPELEDRKPAGIITMAPGRARRRRKSA